MTETWFRILRDFDTVWEVYKSIFGASVVLVSSLSDSTGTVPLASGIFPLFRFVQCCSQRRVWNESVEVQQNFIVAHSMSQNWKLANAAHSLGDFHYIGVGGSHFWAAWWSTVSTGSVCCEFTRCTFRSLRRPSHACNLVSSLLLRVSDRFKDLCPEVIEAGSNCLMFGRCGSLQHAILQSLHSRKSENSRTSLGRR